MTDTPGKHLPTDGEAVSESQKWGSASTEPQKDCLLSPEEAPQTQQFCISEASRKNMQSLKSERLETRPSYKITNNKMTLAMSPSVGDFAFFHLEGGQAVTPRGT